MPLLPCTSASHIAGMSFPTGVTAPMPVTATRRFGAAVAPRLLTTVHGSAGPNAVALRIHGARKIREPFVPPRPIEFESAMRTFAARAVFGT